MTDQEQDDFYQEILLKLFEDTQDAKESVLHYTLPEYTNIIEDYDSILSDLKFLIDKTKTIDDLADQDDTLIDNFFEYLFNYASNFCIDENPANKKNDEAEYEKIQELLLMFTDDEDFDEEEEI